MSNSILKLDELVANYDNKKTRQNWIRGKVPNHYKRTTLSREEIVKYAKIGARIGYENYEKRLFFNQSLFLGLATEGEYRDINITTPSQYGKSYLMGIVAIELAIRGEPVYIVASTKDKTDIIMKHVIMHLQTCDEKIKEQLSKKVDQVERLKKTVSKTKIGFLSGGFIECASLDDESGDAKKSVMVGNAGHYIFDEADLIKNDKLFSELGRNQFKDKVDNIDKQLGIEKKIYKTIMISNPHRGGYFWKQITKDDVNIKSNECVIWLDILTSLEEENTTIDDVYASNFIEDDDTVTTYYLCEMATSKKESMFKEFIAYDQNMNSVIVNNLTYFMGIDSAYKGDDELAVGLLGVDQYSRCFVSKVFKMEKKDWVDGVTDIEIVDKIVEIIEKYNVKFGTMDASYGNYLKQEFSRRGIYIKEIYFNGNEEVSKNGRFLNNRALMYSNLASLNYANKLYVENEIYDIMQEEASATQITLTDNNKIKLIPKIDIKKILGHSPDTLDCAVLAYHALKLYIKKDNFGVYAS